MWKVAKEWYLRGIVTKGNESAREGRELSVRLFLRWNSQSYTRENYQNLRFI
jgi:hypothetical protein